MASLIGQLNRATYILNRHLEERIAETGMYASEFLVLRTAMLDTSASTALVRRAVGMRDAAFSDVIRRACQRGYVTVEPFPSDRRTRRIALTIPGRTTMRIATDIYWDLEAMIGSAPWRLESFGRLRELGDALDALPPAARTEDGLPAVTA
ncbi:MAG TPA: MarR family winged helix-turn-helix transcriptional regulator [Candidatus Limnocylindrales bacterium]|jgi:DNA-binding MarR family transcriptional regulator|nr:MarR family winged helix-turn-helix transcriptional regulator [Candidatus Limnocylindrales bacterium]